MTLARKEFGQIGTGQMTVMEPDKDGEMEFYCHDSDGTAFLGLAARRKLLAWLLRHTPLDD